MDKYERLLDVLNRLRKMDLPNKGELYDNIVDIENNERQKVGQLEPPVIVKLADKLVAGCTVMMKADSGMEGYGNIQCVKTVCEPLSEISLYGHNQNYKTWDIKNIVSYPYIESKFSK